MSESSVLYLSGLISRRLLLMEVKGGLWSGFSLQHAFRSVIKASSHMSAERVGLRGSPARGTLICLMISECRTHNE